MDETVGGLFRHFGRFDKEYDMAGADDIGHYDKEYGENCQVLTMVECVGEFDFFASATCFDFFSSVEELDGNRKRQGRVCPLPLHDARLEISDSAESLQGVGIHEIDFIY